MTDDLLDSSRGWFRVPRWLMDPQHPFSPYRTGERASRREALIDLIALARFEDGADAARGEARVSLRFLAERWGWSKSTVSRFLGELHGGPVEWRPGKPGKGTGRLRIRSYDDLQAPPRGTRVEHRRATPRASPSAEHQEARRSADSSESVGHPPGGRQRDTSVSSERDKEKEEEQRRLSEGHEGYASAEEAWQSLADRARREAGEWTEL